MYFKEVKEKNKVLEMSVYKPENSEMASRIYNSVDNIVIKYTAEWCGPCKRIAPIFEKLGQQYNNIAFMEVDIEKCVGFSGKKPSLPTFDFRCNGTLVLSFSGADEKKLVSSMSQFDEYIQSLYSQTPA